MTFIIVTFILSLDQFTKFLARKNLLLNNPVPVIKNVFYLTLVHNRGAAFGILKNQIYFFIITSGLAIALIWFSLRNNRHKQPFIFNFALNLILAGGLGNLIDRLFFGYVIDFIDIRIYPLFNWPVFNAADSAITVGAILLGWGIITSRDKGLPLSVIK
ncbi:MAG: signal peptidase II [Candidatus Omnitrophota bacterium]